MVFVVRSEADPVTIAEPVRKIIQGIDPAQPIADIRTMEAIVGETYSRQRFSALLLSAFSIASLLLAGVGIYGVLAYSVTERTREIGVRIALGAEPGRIVAMIAGSAARLVLAGAAVGIGGALALSGLLKTILFGVGPRDPVSFILAPALIVGVAILAPYLPARRASGLSPMDALRIG
jgi:putative ABC transport system permease protein